jgi:Prealbumin-like fold domain
MHTRGSRSTIPPRTGLIRGNSTVNLRTHTLAPPTTRVALAFLAIGALALSMALLARPAIVQASGTIGWGGNGSDNLPCDNGAHWVLAPADGIDSATLHVGAASYNMTQSGQGSWSADSAGPVPSDQTQVWVTFTGPGDNSDKLQLSHCLDAPDGASLLIRKRNAVSPYQHLAGAVFSVEINGSVLGTFTTDSDGAICLTGLPFTVKATVTEITPPPGFDLPSETTQVVWVDDNDVCQSAEAIFTDAPTTSSQSASASASGSASGSQSASASASASGSASGSASASASGSASGSAEGSVSAAASGSVEGSVKAATGSPGASVPNTAFSIDGSSPVLPIIFALLLLAGLAAMAYANVRTSNKS